MTGMSGNDSRAAIAKETGLAEATLAQLGVGQFYVKVGNRPAFRLDVPTFLIGNRRSAGKTGTASRNISSTPTTV